MNTKISFLITNYNTKKYTQWSYNSIRKNLSKDHEIVLIDDGSVDGTWDLLKELKSKDPNLIIHKNKTNIGIAYSFNKMVDLSTNETICMLHSDMYVPPKFDEIMLNYMNQYDFITSLRVEPDVGYPKSVDKLIIDFGKESENFKESEFLNWSLNNNQENKGKIESRMFFPWMMKKFLYQKIGGNDLLFLKYMVEDDDFYLRIKMSGAKYCQLFETAVYHMPSKSVRMREDQKINFDNQYNKSIRNFIRKWGVHPENIWHKENGDILVPHKYDIGLVIRNCSYKILHLLEPWCSNICIDNKSLISKYILEEQENTLYDLSSRVHHTESILKNKVVVNFDSIILNNAERVMFLQNLPRYLFNNTKIGKARHDIFDLNITSLERIKNISFKPIHCLEGIIKDNIKNLLS